jgi:hypothetical protein
MVRHIVLWKLKPEKKSDAERIAAELGKKFRTLPGIVAGLRAIEVGLNYGGGDYDLALCCTFDSREAQAAYQTHPAHLAIKADVHAVVCGRTAVDYDIAE